MNKQPFKRCARKLIGDEVYDKHKARKYMDDLIKRVGTGEYNVSTIKDIDNEKRKRKLRRSNKASEL